MNITWVHPAFLLLIPLFFVLFLVRQRHHSRSQIARPKVKHLFASPSGATKSMEAGLKIKRGGGWFGVIALCLATLAMARPQWGEIQQKTYERSREVIIALDLSRSMLATDVSPNRLERAKLLVDSLVNELEGERIGLVVFAGTSFVQYPLSNDYEILREMLKEVNPSFLPQQGTDFGKLLQTSFKAFDFSSASDRFLIVLSDGEDLAGDWETQLKSFINSRIHIISLGIGTSAGSVLPENGGGVIKDEKGAVVLSRLDNRVLQELANKTTGRYVDAYKWVDLGQIISQTVNQGEKGEFAKKQLVLKVERFQIPLGLALLFALLSLWRDFPVYPRHSMKKPSHLERSLDRHLKKKATPPPIPTGATLLFLMLLPLSAQLSPTPEAPEPEKKLAATVQTLSSRDQLSSSDYSQFAQETITYGKAQQQAKASIEMGTLDDALLGVDEGEALDSKAADWPKLRQELEELKKKASDPDQKKQDKKDQDKKDENKDQKQDQQKDSGSGGQNEDKQKNQDSKQDPHSEGQDKKDQKDQKDQPSKNQDSKGQDSKDQGSKNQQPASDGQEPEKQPSEGGDEDQPKEGKDQKDKNPPQNPDQNPKESKEIPDPKNQPGSAGGDDKNERPPETKPVGGGGANGQKSEKDNATEGQTAEVARKLDQIKQKDSPGKIYQLFNPQQPSPQNQGKTW